MTKSWIFVVVFLGVWSALAQPQPARKPNFTGVWILDLKQSQLQVPAPQSGTFRIKHNEPRFLLLRTFVAEGKEDTLSLELTTDGKEVVRHDGPIESRDRLYWRGDSLVLDGVLLRGGKQATNVVEYTLSRDGKTLTATERFRGPKLSYDNTWVFRKQ